ncbi:hypothetical protein [Undibacterium sp. TJN19]|uniref:hypothetical protein n=1 Tax=Undibacterium sp. TJN19 TaxID=3413055 RepID=UPI003BF139E8
MFNRCKYFVTAFVLLSMACFSYAESVTTTCGDSKFEVQMKNEGGPLETKFDLYGIKGKEKKKLFTLGAGNFDAVCMKNKSGKAMLVFQSDCGGSVCVPEYGIVETDKLGLLLTPGQKNKSNAKAAEKILSTPVPDLSEVSEKFCCEIKKR